MSSLGAVSLSSHMALVNSLVDNKLSATECVFNLNTASFCSVCASTCSFANVHVCMCVNLKLIYISYSKNELRFKNGLKPF